MSDYARYNLFRVRICSRLLFQNIYVLLNQQQEQTDSNKPEIPGEAKRVIQMISYEKSNLGTVTFQGREFDLTTESDFTSRVLESRYRNYNDASEGETYDVEFSAQGKDSEGNEVTVYWMFEFVKGAEPEDLSDLDWGMVARVEEQ